MEEPQQIAPVHCYYWHISDWAESQPEKFKVDWVIMSTEDNMLSALSFVKYIEIISKNCYDEHKLIWEIKKKKIYYSSEDLPGGLYRTRLYTPEGLHRIEFYEGLELDRRNARMVPEEKETEEIREVEGGEGKVCP